MSAELTILHLYPGELGINGDRGNVTTLVARARWRGLSARIHDHSPGGSLPELVDAVHIGSGPVAAMRQVHEDVLRIAPVLRQWAAAGIPILAIAGGWQLLGTELRLPGGERIDGAGVFPSSATLTETRAVGEALVSSEWGTLAGFENHASVTRLEPDALPLGTVLRGSGNGADGPADAASRAEGVRVGMCLGTHLHGSLLPLNPSLADAVLAAALTHSGAAPELGATPETQRADEYAARAREAIAARLGMRAAAS